MKQSFLDSLVGLNTKEAEKLCADNGIKTWVMPSGAISIAIAFNGVKVYTSQDGNTVESAVAGDPLSIEE